MSGYDIKASDDTLFADIKNKHNTMNCSSAESLFQKLAHYANTHKKAIDDFLSSKTESAESPNSALKEIKRSAEKSGRSIINEITFENYSYYLGFDKLK